MGDFGTLKPELDFRDFNSTGQIIHTGIARIYEPTPLSEEDSLPPINTQGSIPAIIPPSHFCSVTSLIQRCQLEPQVPPLWSGIVKGSMGFVFGPAKSGKTVWCETFGTSIAARMEKFWGRPLDSLQVNGLLFISMEEHWEHRAMRNQRQLSSIGIMDGQDFPYMVVKPSFPRYMTGKKDWETLEATISDSEADLVFIDSFTRLEIDEIEKSKVANRVLSRLKELAMKLKITLVIIHHSSKITDQPLGLATMAGSRVVGQEADFILGINRLSNGTRYFKEVSTRYTQESELVTTFTIGDDFLVTQKKEVTESSLFRPVDHRENSGNQELVFRTIQELQEECGVVKTSELIARLHGKLQKTVIYSYLNNLEEEGLIDRSQKGVIIL